MDSWQFKTEIQRWQKFQSAVIRLHCRLHFTSDAPDCQSAGITSCLLHLLVALFAAPPCLQVKEVFFFFLARLHLFGTSALQRNHSQRKVIAFISGNCLMPWYLQPATLVEMPQRSAGCGADGPGNYSHVVRPNIKSVALMTKSSACGAKTICLRPVVFICSSFLKCFH